MVNVAFIASETSNRSLAFSGRKVHVFFKYTLSLSGIMWFFMRDIGHFAQK